MQFGFLCHAAAPGKECDEGDHMQLWLLPSARDAAVHLVHAPTLGWHLLQAAWNGVAEQVGHLCKRWISMQCFFTAMSVL